MDYRGKTLPKKGENYSPQIQLVRLSAKQRGSYRTKGRVKYKQVFREISNAMIMKKPYYNLLERMLIYNNTLFGDLAILRLRVMQLRKVIIKEITKKLNL